MVDFEQMLDNLMQVERRGFNPYTQAYSAALEPSNDSSGTQQPFSGESGLKESSRVPMGDTTSVNTSQQQMRQPTQPVNDPPRDTKADIIAEFEKLGMDNPFDNIVTGKGDINYEELNKAYRIIGEDKDRKDKYGEPFIDIINEENKDAFDEKFGDGKRLVVGEDDALRLSRKEKNDGYIEFNKQRTWKGDDIFIEMIYDKHGKFIKQGDVLKGQDELSKHKEKFTKKENKYYLK